MTEEPLEQNVGGTADLSFPPDPFNHGPCRVRTCTFGQDGGPAPAVFEGGLCAQHAATIGNLSVAAGVQERLKRAAADHRPSGQKAQAKAKRKAAAKSRGRNRR